jgi:hypothetical protein
VPQATETSARKRKQGILCLPGNRDRRARAQEKGFSPFGDRTKRTSERTALRLQSNRDERINTKRLCASSNRDKRKQGTLCLSGTRDICTFQRQRKAHKRRKATLRLQSNRDERISARKKTLCLKHQWRVHKRKQEPRAFQATETRAQQERRDKRTSAREQLCTFKRQRRGHQREKRLCASSKRDKRARANKDLCASQNRDAAQEESSVPFGN